MIGLEHSALRRTFGLTALVCAFMAGSALANEPPSNLCSLLAPSQLEKSLGQPFAAPQKSTAPAAFAGQPSGTQCEYVAQKGQAIKVSFIAYVDPSETQAKQTFDRLAAYYQPKSKPAVGDSAYFDAHHAIHVLKGKVRFYIAIEPAGASKMSPFLSYLSGSKSGGGAGQENQVKDLAAGVASKL